MSRSKWKGPYISLQNLNQIKKNNKFLIFPRNIEVLPIMVEKTLKVYNGKTYKDITINEEMIGYKLGVFSFTRSNFSFKKKKSKK